MEIIPGDPEEREQWQTGKSHVDKSQHAHVYGHTFAGRAGMCTSCVSVHRHVCKYIGTQGCVVCKGTGGVQKMCREVCNGVYLSVSTGVSCVHVHTWTCVANPRRKGRRGVMGRSSTPACSESTSSPVVGSDPPRDYVGSTHSP